MKNSNQLRLSPSTSIQALVAQARRAAALEVVERKIRKARKANQRKLPKVEAGLSPIELSARSIREYIAKNAGRGTTACNEAPDRFSSAYAVISVYSDADIEAKRIARERIMLGSLVRIPSLRPKIKYVLYPSALDPTQLGSVAIYCDNAVTRYAAISKSRQLFGIPVKRISLETGISQYVDVVFED